MILKKYTIRCYVYMNVVCVCFSLTFLVYRGCSAYTEPQRLVSSDGLQMLTCKHSYQCDSDQICVSCVCAAKCTYSSNCTNFQVGTHTPVFSLVHIWTKRLQWILTSITGQNHFATRFVRFIDHIAFWYEFLRDKVYVFYTYVQVCFDGLCTEKCNSRQLISEDSDYDEVDDRECSSGTDVCLDGLNLFQSK